jgi:hypothetical protein
MLKRTKDALMNGSTVTLDSVACRIAADAGIAWPELPDFPGFSKGRWRDDARWLIAQIAPLARVIDGARQWNGKVGDALVANLSDEDIRNVIETGRHRLGPKPR